MQMGVKVMLSCTKGNAARDLMDVGTAANGLAIALPPGVGFIGIQQVYSLVYICGH